ncbi:MAG: type IV pilin-like G/H family protein [Elusimicrobium sp.]|nr:type IV pilin-like G/H family protein [Elusimicrobium sp.]
MAAVALPQYTKAVEKSRAAEAIILIKALRDAQRLYFLENGVFAADINDLVIQTPGTDTNYYGVAKATKNFTLVAHDVTTPATAHIQAQRSGLNYYIAVYLATDRINCVAANSNQKGLDFCKQLGGAPIACPEAGYTCFPM